MIYIITGVLIVLVALRYKSYVKKTSRIIGFAYLGVVILQAIASTPILPFFLGGRSIAEIVLQLALGIAFIVYGTSEIRMPHEELIEDDMGDNHNILAH